MFWDAFGRSTLGYCPCKGVGEAKNRVFLGYDIIATKILTVNSPIFPKNGLLGPYQCIPNHSSEEQCTTQSH